ncbi:acyltransferase [Ammoniphilus sp. CFH 90114]|uniref:acyltransferase n=1 Tax=Ammoniphilus sp. CFH 90114 TaxID=2493665 RepID=UPI00100E3DD6|nr:acyltransferase [Ammoniphilus sp. CFH 90114]RXT04112.1 acyltransferase [Ammoniphilus sp. CFH 90114]
MAERFRFLDFIKGWSILGVIVIHIELLITADHPLVVMGQIIDMLFRFAVPVFIGVLGFMTYNKYWGMDNWDSFLLHKARTYGIPYLIWSTVYYFTPDIYYLRPDLGVLSSVVFGYSEVHLYFMVAYFGFILLTPFIVLGGRQMTASSLTGVLVSVVILHLGLLYTAEQSIWQGSLDTFYLNTDARLPLHWMSFYALGLLLAIHQERVVTLAKKGNKILIRVCMALSYLLFAVFLVESRRTYFIYYTPFLVPFSVLALLLLGGLYPRVESNRLVSFITFIGRNTFPIYLSHILWIKIAYLFVAQGQVSMIYLLLIFLLVVLGSVAWIRVERDLKVIIGNIVFTLTRRKRIARKLK